jgi:DNA modification methylase
VDLIVTSPPYWALRDYRDDGKSLAGQIGSEETWQEYVASLVACMAECARVLKPQGSIFINLADKYGDRGHGPNQGKGTGRGPQSTSLRQTRGPREKSLLGLPWRFALACCDDLGLILRRDVIWHKVNPLPESVTDRCRSTHEYLFHFVKQPRYFAAMDEIRTPHTMRPQRRPNGHKERQKLGVLPAQTYSTSRRDEPGVDGHPLGALPGSVWEIPSAPLSVPAHLGVDHFAAFPPALVRPVILGWSPPGICTACGEGRHPVAAASFDTQGRTTNGPKNDTRRTAGALNMAASIRAVRETTVLGYACSCTPYTDHPGTPGRQRDGQAYARETGRDAHPHGGVGMLPRTGPWREYHLDAWTPPPTRPALVVDPFGGTGTTALVADVLGRTGISVDRSMDYARLAKWRTSDPGERAKAMEVPKPPKQADGQGALFGTEEAS